jgi:hypothetical protein
MVPWKGWAERSQTAARGNAQQASIVLAQLRREREDVDQFVARCEESRRHRRRG